MCFHDDNSGTNQDPASFELLLAPCYYTMGHGSGNCRGIVCASLSTPEVEAKLLPQESSN